MENGNLEIRHAAIPAILISNSHFPISKSQAFRLTSPLLLVAAAIVAVMLGGCDLANQSVAADKASGDQNTMNSTAPVLTEAHKIPPIDAHAPRRTETATFALG